MPVLYKTIQSTMKTKDGDKLYHPRTVYVGSGIFFPLQR